VERAGTGLQKIVADGLKQASPSEAPLLAWPLACGSSVANRTAAIGYAGGVLRVQLASTEWKRELESLAPQYLAILNRYVGGGVKRIEFVVAGSGSNVECQ
jgi:hypothetical protein